MPYALGEEGHLLTFPGRTTDPKAVATKIAELHGKYKIKALAYDRWRIEDIERELDAIGCNVELVPFGQGFKDLSPAVDVLSAWSRKENCATATIRCSRWRRPMPSRNRRSGKSKVEQAKINRPHRPACRACMAVGIAARPAPVIDVSTSIG